MNNVGRKHCGKVLSYDSRKNLARLCHRSAKWRVYGEGGDDDYVDSCNEHLAVLAYEQANPRCVIEHHDGLLED